MRGAIVSKADHNDGICSMPSMDDQASVIFMYVYGDMMVERQW